MVKYVDDMNMSPILPGMHVIFPVGYKKKDMKLARGVVEHYTRKGWLAIKGFQDDDALLVKSDETYYVRPEALFVFGVPVELQEQYMEIMNDRQQ